MLFKEEIKTKNSIISNYKNDFEIVRNSVKQTVSLIDITHLCCLFLVCNESKLVKYLDNISWFCRDNIPLFNMSSPWFIYSICTAATQL